MSTTGGNSSAFGFTADGGLEVGSPSYDGADGSVVISYATGTMTAVGGTITIDGGNTVHTFSASGSFVVTSVAGSGWQVVARPESVWTIH